MRPLNDHHVCDKLSNRYNASAQPQITPYTLTYTTYAYKFIPHLLSQAFAERLPCIHTFVQILTRLNLKRCVKSISRFLCRTDGGEPQFSNDADLTEITNKQIKALRNFTIQQLNSKNINNRLDSKHNY